MDVVGHGPAQRYSAAGGGQMVLHTVHGCQGYLVTNAKDRVNNLGKVGLECGTRHSGQANLVGEALRDKRRFTDLLGVADGILKMVSPAEHLLNV